MIRLGLLGIVQLLEDVAEGIDAVTIVGGVVFPAVDEGDENDSPGRLAMGRANAGFVTNHLFHVAALPNIPKPALIIELYKAQLVIRGGFDDGFGAIACGFIVCAKRLVAGTPYHGQDQHKEENCKSGYRNIHKFLYISIVSPAAAALHHPIVTCLTIFSPEIIFELFGG
jgi:hypothetical protein